MGTMTGPDDPTLLVRLFSWLSPAFPIGGFAFSQGLETAIVSGKIRDGRALGDWIGGALHAGSIRTDALVLALAHRAAAAGAADAFIAINALAHALQVSAERDVETREQARSFVAAAAAWPLDLPDWLIAALDGQVTLPVAVGALAARQGIAAGPVLAGFINAFVAQQISVAVRLVPLGQTEGLQVQAALEPQVVALTQTAQHAQIGDIGGLGYAADIAAMRHETQSTRIFRS